MRLASQPVHVLPSDSADIGAIKVHMESGGTPASMPVHSSEHAAVVAVQGELPTEAPSLPWVWCRLNQVLRPALGSTIDGRGVYCGV